MSALKDMVGLVFGRLTVVSRDDNSTAGNAQWCCVCSCGNKKNVDGRNLRRGLTKSCGCFRDERIRDACVTHGASRTLLYGIWSGMIARCENKENNRYKDWGGRGISVCVRWRESFANFAFDMGPRPTSFHTLERKDNALGYEPGNCVWALRTTQARNTRATKLTPELAREAKYIRDSGGNLSAWARLNNVSQPVAWFAATGTTWGDCHDGA